MIRGVYISGWFLFWDKNPNFLHAFGKLIPPASSSQPAARCTLNYQGLELTIHASYQAHVAERRGISTSVAWQNAALGASERCFRTLVNGHQLRLVYPWYIHIYISHYLLGIWLSHSVWKNLRQNGCIFALNTALKTASGENHQRIIFVEGPDFEKKQGEK